MFDRLLAPALLLLALLVVTACASDPLPLDEAPPWEPAGEWGQRPIWDDGQAEVATYDSIRQTYGEPRHFELHLISVKETFNTEHWVKADSEPEPGHALEVLKQNQVERWETENYPYTAMTSVFVARQDVTRPVKVTMAHSEWCGNTFKELAGWLDPPMLRTHSYWDGEGDRDLELELLVDRPLLLLDQLPLTLRSLPFAEGYELEFALMPSLVSSKVGAPQPRPATLRVLGMEEVTCGLGDVPAWRVEVSWENETAQLWFAQEHEQVPVRFQMPGRSAVLKTLRRWAYWDRTQPDPER